MFTNTFPFNSHWHLYCHRKCLIGTCESLHSLQSLYLLQYEPCVSWLCTVVCIKFVQHFQRCFGAGLSPSSNTFSSRARRITTFWSCTLGIISKSARYPLPLASFVPQFIEIAWLGLGKDRWRLLRFRHKNNKVLFRKKMCDA